MTRQSEKCLFCGFSDHMLHFVTRQNVKDNKPLTIFCLKFEELLQLRKCDASTNTEILFLAFRNNFEFPQVRNSTSQDIGVARWLLWEISYKCTSIIECVCSQPP